MKRILGFTGAALLGASILAVPAIAGPKGAADTGRSGGDRVLDAQSGTHTMPGVDSATTAAIPPTFDSALTAIDGSATSTQSIATVSEVREVQVVRLNDLKGHDTAAVDKAVSEHRSDIDGLRSAIEANSALSGKLRDQNVDVSNVVAAQVQADGVVTIFVM